MSAEMVSFLEVKIMVAIMLLILGVWLSLPWWYFSLLGAHALWRVGKFFYKAGKHAEKNNN